MESAKNSIPKSYDVIGDIVILKFHEDDKRKLVERKRIAKRLIEEKPAIKCVFEKTDRIKGRLRTLKLRYLAGENRKETIHRENGCRFKLNIEKCYFSPRLSGERLEIALDIAKKSKKKDKVAVFFAGVAPFSILIAKKTQKISEIVSVELGQECSRYARENVKLNKVSDRVEVIQGDVKRFCIKGKKKKEAFDIIVMARPNLKNSFLSSALKVSKKGTIIYYYGFCHEDELRDMIDNLFKEAEEKRKLKILNCRKAGDIAPFKYRWMIEFKVVK